MVPAELHPASGATERASMSEVTPAERLQVPTQSMSFQRLAATGSSPGTSATAWRPWAGRIRATTAAEMKSSPSWPQNSARQPMNSMTGEPTVTPSTGPPAPTRDHHPSAFTRSSGAKRRMMRAIDAVPVAAPWTPSRARANSKMPTLGASAVSTADTIAPERPSR